MWINEIHKTKSSSASMDVTIGTIINQFIEKFWINKLVRGNKNTTKGKEETNTSRYKHFDILWNRTFTINKWILRNV